MKFKGYGGSEQRPSPSRSEPNARLAAGRPLPSVDPKIRLLSALLDASGILQLRLEIEMINNSSKQAFTSKYPQKEWKIEPCHER